jgi:peptidyl-prolyl cis-trans isomerase SurA
MDTAMPKISVRVSLWAGCLAGALFFAAVAAMPSPAEAQVVVVANGSPITDYDIEQRTKLITVSTHKKPTRQEVIQELIDDRLKIAKAKTFGFEESPAAVNQAFDSMATRQHITVKQFIAVLARAGIAPDTIKARIKADLTWTELIRGKFQDSLQVGEADIERALLAQHATESVGYVYTLYPITVVIPAGSSPAVVAAKHREAEALRASFVNCKQGLDYARGLRDVAVREPVTRSSGDLAPQLRELLGQMELGHLTAPDTTDQGLQMFAVCDKKQTMTASPLEAQIRNQIYTERFQVQSKRYLAELRASAMIEYKDASGKDIQARDRK